MERNVLLRNTVILMEDLVCGISVFSGSKFLFLKVPQKLRSPVQHNGYRAASFLSMIGIVDKTYV